MHVYDAGGKRKYLTPEERAEFLRATEAEPADPHVLRDPGPLGLPYFRGAGLARYPRRSLRRGPRVGKPQEAPQGHLSRRSGSF